jgi:hypothetical protein
MYRQQWKPMDRAVFCVLFVALLLALIFVVFPPPARLSFSSPSPLVPSWGAKQGTPSPRKTSLDVKDMISVMKDAS